MILSLKIHYTNSIFSPLFLDASSHLYMRVCPSVCRSVCLSVGLSLCNPFFLKPYMSRFLYENHQDDPTLTLLNVLNVLRLLSVLSVLNVPNMPMDASLACWALFYLKVIARVDNYVYGETKNVRTACTDERTKRWGRWNYLCSISVWR